MKKLRETLLYIDRKGWYADLTKCGLIFATWLFFIVFCCCKTITAQNQQYYEPKTIHYAPGIIGLSSVPVALITVGLRDKQWSSQYGDPEPYMPSYKVDSYNELSRTNNQILVASLGVTLVGVVVQHIVNEKIRKKRKVKRSLPCTHF